MSTNNIVALTFLILGLGFIISLFRSIFNVIGMKKTVDNFNGMMIIKEFSLPILCFVGLVVFVLVILPRIS